jgi:hypothetical protein
MATQVVMTLLAAQTALWLALGLGALVFAFALPLLAVCVAVFDGGADDIADVQRFVELTEEARRSLPTGLPLFDPDRAEGTTAAIVRFQAKKEEARRALWASRDRRRAVAIAERTTAHEVPRVREARHGDRTAGHRDRIGGGLVGQG